MSRMYEALKNAQQRGAAIEVPEVAVQEGTVPSIPEPPRGTYAVCEAPARRQDGENIRCLPVQLPSKAAIIPWSSSDSLGGEQYRIIRTRIVQHPARPKVMVVSSACSGDGKTVSAINIAGILSLRDKTTVLLIDADFRRSGISSALGLPTGPGLSETLSRSCMLQDAIVRVEQYPNLYVLTTGAAHTSAGEFLDSDQWKFLCASVREHFTFVVIDAPPVAAVADYELIQARCDGVILVVRPDHTDRTLLNTAFDLVPDAKRLGVVMNCADEWFLWRTHESYFYAHGR